MTEADLPKLLSQLEENTNKLNAESNSINNIIESVELRLRNANPGVTCIVKSGSLSVRDEDGSTESGDLGFGKSGGVWGIFVYNLKRKSPTLLSPIASLNDEPAPVPLVKVSRELRIAALSQLPTLIEELSTKVRERLKAIQDAKKLVY